LKGKYPEIPGIVTNIEIYDPINTRGQLVFWIRAIDGTVNPPKETQAIVRATLEGQYFPVPFRIEDNNGSLTVTVPTPGPVGFFRTRSD
jgi:hypothetical protein